MYFVERERKRKRERVAQKNNNDRRPVLHADKVEIPSDAAGVQINQIAVVYTQDSTSHNILNPI